VTAAGSSPRAGPSVCPFVALAEDRDRRADAPDERNRCYAERAPRRRDLSYQAEYCYSPGFASCSIFLAWAARNAAEPAYVTDAARAAWASGIAVPEGSGTPDERARSRFAWGTGDQQEAGQSADVAPPDGWGGGAADSGPEDGFFGPVEQPAVHGVAAEEHDWISASAWAAAPWDPLAEAEAEELESLPIDDVDPVAVDGQEQEIPAADEALQGPKVPAALPMRRRQRAQAPIKARGSGEWLYADPLERRPIVRRDGIGAPILLGVLALLVITILVFLLPALLGGERPQLAAQTSPSPAASHRTAPTRAPQETGDASLAPSVAPEPRIRVYTVRAGNTLSGIAARFDVTQRQLQCLNVITNPNLLAEGQRLLIPPEAFTCPSGWRNMTPPPIPEA
jgi:hypothetical protein